MRDTRLTSRRLPVAVAATAALALTLAACGDNGDNGADPEEPGTENGDENGDDPADESDDDAAGDGGTITLGYLPSWTDGLSMAYLLDYHLTEAGYDVVHEEFTEAGVLYTALASGDVDIYPSAWLPLTHGSYMESYEGDVEDLGMFYEGAVLTLAVPEYSDIDSITDLPDHVDALGGQIVGIEPGAGHMEVTADTVFPTYGLDEAGFDLAESSTSVMLTELEQAMNAEEDIVVTLWRPFWAYAEFDVKDLDDPEGALGDPEGLHFIANSEFSAEFPDVADWLGGLTLDDDTYGALEGAVAVDHEDDPAAGVQQFQDENPDAVPSID
ncbi:glycine betaine ABC transporter substrate-binding protein [Bogoriella caseilytica]|uniref:Glycine betaine/proline transport system substrate-binding protein n=1 Tax=Bogoriella caseilytica TaxID=56055 RepID=A0A3N2BA00_9MICO|nr:glycine betaine ABC transporter substrate-binding protein [Bogoriella caseilytica]ROR72100.1 glycine betaine/proline transport system substrate-binding protein [Bogoriella caseilytica]